MSKGRIEKCKNTRFTILFFNARAYEKVAYLLLDNLFNNLDYQDTDCNLLSPIATNLFFAIEDYIKYICAYDNMNKVTQGQSEFRKSHSLAELYSFLQKSRKAELLNRLAIRGCDKETFYRFKRRTKKNGTINGDSVNWRYLVNDAKKLYSLDINIMCKIADSLHEIASEILNFGDALLTQNMQCNLLDEVSMKIVKGESLTGSTDDLSDEECARIEKMLSGQ